ncbi:capsular polysaccharide export protein, LipB/KpsS family [Stenotrophomonas humi]
MKLFHAVELAISESILSRNILHEQTTIFVWNGASVMGEVARRMQSDHGCRAIFMEIANLPGKIFADPHGTNAQSILFKHPRLLDQFPDTKNAFPAWREQFIVHKRVASVVPQAATARRLAWHHLSDAFHAITIGYRLFSWKAAADKVRAKIQALTPSINDIAAHPELPERYVFLPLQVSSDMQLLLNSNINNIQALQQIATTCPLPLVVKAHPAETNTRYIQRAVERNKTKHSIHLTSANTTSLIEGASAVYTINSTTGLEALLFKVPVHFLSNSLYSHLNEENLANYVVEYLIDLDFFAPSNTPISLEVITTLYRRATIQPSTLESQGS